MTGTPEDRLRELLDEGDDGMKELLLRAEQLANERVVFARRRGLGRIHDHQGSPEPRDCCVGSRGQNAARRAARWITRR